MRFAIGQQRLLGQRIREGNRFLDFLVQVRRLSKTSDRPPEPRETSIQRPVQQGRCDAT